MSRLSEVLEQRIEGALSALDPSRAETLRMAAEHGPLADEVSRLRAEVESLRAELRRLRPAGPQRVEVLETADGRAWEVRR